MTNATTQKMIWIFDRLILHCKTHLQDVEAKMSLTECLVRDIYLSLFRGAFDYTDEKLLSLIKNIIDEDFSAMESEELLELAEEAGWDESEYYELCEYNTEDEAWYLKDGGSLSILDHAQEFLYAKISNMR